MLRKEIKFSFEPTSFEDMERIDRLIRMHQTRKHTIDSGYRTLENIREHFVPLEIAEQVRETLRKEGIEFKEKELEYYTRA